MKRWKRPTLSRRGRLLRNTALAAALLCFFWLLAGTPSLGRGAAFRRALRENLLPEGDAPVVLAGQYSDSLFARVGDIVVQADVRRIWGPFWDNAMGAAVTEATGAAFIIPLTAYNYGNGPHVAVLAEGVRGELTLRLAGRDYQMKSLTPQDGYFLFRFDQESWNLEEGNDASRVPDSLFMNSFRQLDLPDRTYIETLEMAFRSYDAAGTLLVEETRTWEE